MEKIILGFDVGGTKCAVTVARAGDSGVEFLAKDGFLTRRRPWREVCDEMIALGKRLAAEQNVEPELAGISCGGPLNSKTGYILSPPNLPGWDNVPANEYFTNALGVPSRICNDANACAVAEWLYGAGRGLENVLFLTFGTGLGAGLILNGKLYSGACDLAGETGHVRIAPFGPSGFGKEGSFEGFCSGGGIAELARTFILRERQKGNKVAFCPDDESLAKISAKTVAEAADAGDPLAKYIYEYMGEKLGEGLAMLIDLFNPDAIILGSIYPRSRHLFEEQMRGAIAREAIPDAAAVCRILPAELGEKIGDYAAVCAALA